MSVSINDIYEKIINLLEQNNANFRLVEHTPEGQTELVSQASLNSFILAAYITLTVLLFLTSLAGRWKQIYAN